jgi:hypothetical protein
LQDTFLIRRRIMIQFDAGPGDHSDREWEGPEHKTTSQAAKRRRITLPPWALLAILVAVIILLCVGLIMIVRAIGGGSNEDATPTPEPTTEFTPVEPATPTAALVEPTVTLELPTPTLVLPTVAPPETPPATEIGPGATVVVSGTGGQGLRLRAQPTTNANIVVAVKEGTKLAVVEGPQQGDGYTWWKVRTAGGQEGWGAADWLTLEAAQ